MTREEKNQVIDNLAEQINNSPHFYITNSLGLNAQQTMELRRECFKNDVRLVVAKNTLLKKAIEKSEKDLSELTEALKGETSIMFAEVGNLPARMIKSFRKKQGLEKPILKAAYVDESVYMGDQVEMLATLKSKNELIADVVGLLEAPALNVLSALQSGGNTISGVLKTLEERAEN